MTATVPDILAAIVGRKQVEMEELRSRLPKLERLAADRVGKQRGFAKALRGRLAVIAEIKKASPSRGLLSEDFRPADIARSYELGGAAAISVLTDRNFFQGSLDDLQTVERAASLPVLRKDFTLSEAHLIEAAAHHADAILLIAALFTSAELRRLRDFAASLGLDALVEVHDAAELDRAVSSGAQIVGVNNRDLRTFDVKLQTSLDLAPRIPADVIRVSESGILTNADIQRLRTAGYEAFLVGESLMRSPDPARALRELIQCELIQ